MPQACSKSDAATRLEGDPRTGPGATSRIAATRRPNGKGLCAGESTRRSVHWNRGAGVPSPRRNPLEGRCVSHRRGGQRTTYRTWPTESLRTAAGEPDRVERRVPRARPGHRRPHWPGGRRGLSNGRRRATGSTSPAATTSTSQSGHVAGNGSRTSTAQRVRQPEYRPGRVVRRSRCTAGR